MNVVLAQIIVAVAIIAIILGLLVPIRRAGRRGPGA
jgi:hypothetical protein